VYFRPSTFAQAAKLRRTAAAKEQELAKSMAYTTILRIDTIVYP